MCFCVLNEKPTKSDLIRKIMYDSESKIFENDHVPIYLELQKCMDINISEEK